ncbi:MAG: D-alanyl-D-alanine carboxypeptidase [Lachnospiraceae bacterium]|nr:D-alanyl-D-alanine carboxypeptidase [Lachnospiraceae bacterium]
MKIFKYSIFKRIAILLAGIHLFSMITGFLPLWPGHLCSYAAETIDTNTTTLTREDVNAARMAMHAATDDIPGWVSGPPIGSESAVLMDADTGVILYGKNMDVPRYPASTTKIMTALLAAETCSMNEMVTFSKEAVFGIERGSSNVGMDVGEQIRMDEALYCLMLHSANEVAAAIAEHISGSVEEFAHLMNERARELGCTSTDFQNPHGLPNEAHLTTAHDLALIGRAFNANETLRRIASTKYYTIHATATQPDTFDMTNHHKMFPGATYGYDYFVWGKTGYTNVARETLISCAEKDGMTLICAVMKGEPPYQYTDTTDLFEYGFNNFQKLNIAENETRFNLDNSDFFNSDNDAFGNTESLLTLDDKGYCIVPLSTAFEDLTPAVSYENVSEDAIARITYTLGDYYVGGTDVRLNISDVPSFEFGAAVSSNTADEGPDTEEKSDSPAGFSKPNVIFLNTKTVLIIGGIVVLLLLGFFIFVALIRSHRFIINRRIRLKRKSRRYFSEFDDFDF